MYRAHMCCVPGTNVQWDVKPGGDDWMGEMHEELMEALLW